MSKSIGKGILSFMKLEDDYEYDEYDEEDEDEDEDEEYEEESSRKFGFGFFKRSKDADEYDEDEDEDEDEEEEEEKRSFFGRNSKNNVVSMENERNRGKKKMEVRVIRAKQFADSKEIVDELLAGKTVVLNLVDAGFDNAQRLIDFTYGACYAINGHFQKADEFMFVAAPKNVDISGAISEIEAKDNNKIYDI